VAGVRRLDVRAWHHGSSWRWRHLAHDQGDWPTDIGCGVEALIGARGMANRAALGVPGSVGVRPRHGGSQMTAFATWWQPPGAPVRLGPHWRPASPRYSGARLLRQRRCPSPPGRAHQGGLARADPPRSARQRGQEDGWRGGGGTLPRWGPRRVG
jgi:hypothetical protein